MIIIDYYYHHHHQLLLFILPNFTRLYYTTQQPNPIGKSIEDLKAERELENAAAAAAASAPETATEVAARDKLPSEKMYQKLRVDDFD